MKLLIIEDEHDLSQSIADFLKSEDYLCEQAFNYQEALMKLDLYSYDCILLDLMLPGGNGLDILRKIKDQNNPAGVIIISAKDSLDDKVQGLKIGADDYLAKPFDPRELVLRLQAILRRRPQERGVTKKYRIGRWTYDPQVPELTDRDEVVRLTDVEVNLLKALTRHADTILSREDLADLCGVDAGERTIDVQVTRLRRKLEEDSKVPRYLQTVRGKGYLLRAEEITG